LIRPSFVRGSGPAALALFAVFAILSPAINSWAQGEAAENTNPMTGTIQGTLLDEDGNAVVGAKVLYISPDTETRGFTRSVKGGKYVSESLPPGPYVVRVEGRDFLPVESRVTVVVASAVKADFKLEYISPGPARLESQYSGDLSGTLPINGRNYLSPGQLEPGVQVVDGAVYDPGKAGSNRSRSTACWDEPRITTWMKSR
jgi:hypothetical protein